MIELLIPALCLLAATASLVLLQRRRRAKPFDYALQLAIWMSAWMLWQPPAIIPAERHISVDSEELASAHSIHLAAVENISLKGLSVGRDTLRDLAPVRLDISQIHDSDTGWEFDWQRQITLGDSLQLQIYSDRPLAKNLQISLLNPYGDTEESLELKAGEKVQTQLSAIPKLTGPQLYRVQIENTANESHFEPLPILVQKPRQPKVLLWLARPSFETAALSRWLRQSSVSAQVMTQLAPEILRKETLNGLQLTKTEDLLAEVSPFDLLVLDSNLWPQLSSQQKRQLKSLAANKSLLWLVSDDISEDFIQYTAAQSMPLRKVESTDLYPDFGYQPAANPAIPTLRASGFEAAQLSANDLLLGDRESPLFWGRSTEIQHLGFILFSDSHRWLTSGFATEFASLWKSIIDYQLKHLGTQQPITFSNVLPRVLERITLCSPIFSDKSPLLLESRDNSKATGGIPGSKSPQGQCYSFWPQSSGWHQLKTGTAEESVFDLYIFAKEEWPLWQNSLNASETQQMAAARLGPSDNTHSSRSPIERQWPALILLLLMCLSWWRERDILHRELR